MTEQKAYCEYCGTPKDAPNYAYHICVKPTVTAEELEAVKRLQMFFRESPKLVWKYGASDKGFYDWLKYVTRAIHIEDMKRVKQLLEGGTP